MRQAGGLSGYPSRAESEHDWVENSHASTSTSYAYGLAVALDQSAVHDRQVVAVLGDGAMTGGMAYEALNNLGHSGRKAVIVFNDNGRSYAPTVSRISESVARMRLHPSYLRRRARVSRMVRDVPVLGDHLAWGLEGALTGLRDMIEPTAFFETLGLRYSGPFDGHDIEGLERPCATPPTTTRDPSSSTSSRRRAAATHPPRKTRRSACTTRRSSTPRSAPSTCPAGPPRSPAPSPRR